MKVQPPCITWLALQEGEHDQKMTGFQPLFQLTNLLVLDGSLKYSM